MKQILSYFLVCSFLCLAGCVSDNHNTAISPQKIYESVNTKYPSDKNILIFIDAPEGFIAPYQANWEVEKNVDASDVTAIISALALKTSAVIIAGGNNALTNTTLERALTLGADKINGAKVIVIGNKEAQKSLSDLASVKGVSLEFIDNPI